MAGFGLNLKSVLYFKNQCLTENLGFLNPPLLQAAKRYMPFYRDTQNRQTTTKLKVNLLIISKHIIFAPTISSSK